MYMKASEIETELCLVLARSTSHQPSRTCQVRPGAQNSVQASHMKDRDMGT